jgi:four helix bundle protein
MIRSYRDLLAWQKGMDLVDEVYDASAFFPNAERFGLTQQLQKAALSVPSNVAEGHARNSTNAFIYHISVSLGSLAEVETQLIAASRRKYLDEDNLTRLLEHSAELGRILRGLEKSLKAKARRSKIPSP